MKRKSIFKKDSQKIDAAFIEAGHPEKILLVPLDFAKSTHYACFCDGLGRYQRQAFTVKNNREGLDYLVDLIEAARKSRSIKNKQHIIVGGEDSASYTRNFMQRLKELGYLAVRLSSCEVHRQAESADSSTDKTALRAIAKTMLNRDAQLIDGHDIYAELRALTRQRRRIVHLSTAVKNRIHTHADRLFPSFLAKGSALSPFSKASLELMSKPSFGAASISGKNEKILARQLSRQGTPRSSEVAIALKQQAKGASAPAPLRDLITSADSFVFSRRGVVPQSSATSITFPRDYLVFDHIHVPTVIRSILVSVYQFRSQAAECSNPSIIEA